MSLRLGIVWLAAALGSVVYGIPGAAASDFCARDAAAIARLAREPSARLSFQNPGGSLGIGVCWWHSRFQRAAWYLADFRPELAREPGESLARREARMLADQSGVVVIPGYADLATYSRDFRDVIEQELSDWQIRDSVLHGTWVLKPSLPAWLPAALLKRKLAKVQERFIAGGGQPIFQLIQIRKSTGIHSWLLLDIVRETAGYRLRVVDSNYPDRVLEAVYADGENELRYEHVAGAGVVPYEFFDDQARISHAIGGYCE